MKIRWVVRWLEYINGRLDDFGARHITTRGTELDSNDGVGPIFYRVGPLGARPMTFSTREEAEAVMRSADEYWTAQRVRFSSNQISEFKVVPRRVR